MNTTDLIRIFPNELSVNKPVDFDIYNIDRNIIKKKGEIIDPGFMLQINFLKIYKMPDESYQSCFWKGFFVSEYIQNILFDNINQKKGIYLIATANKSGKSSLLKSILYQLADNNVKLALISQNEDINHNNIKYFDITSKDDDQIFELFEESLSAKTDVICVDNILNPILINKFFYRTPDNKTVILTLNSDNAINAIEKLTNIVDNKALSDKLAGIFAQKLTSSLCINCKEKYTAETNEVNKFLNTNLKDINLFKPVGCKICNNTGYIGNIGLQELLLSDNNIKNQLLSGFDTDKIQRYLQETDFKDMKYDCIKKVLCGLIPFSYYTRMK